MYMQNLIGLKIELKLAYFDIIIRASLFLTCHFISSYEFLLYVTNKKENLQLKKKNFNKYSIIVDV